MDTRKEGFDVSKDSVCTEYIRADGALLKNIPRGRQRKEIYLWGTLNHLLFDYTYE